MNVGRIQMGNNKQGPSVISHALPSGSQHSQEALRPFLDPKATNTHTSLPIASPRSPQPGRSPKSPYLVKPYRADLFKAQTGCLGQGAGLAVTGLGAAVAPSICASGVNAAVSSGRPPVSVTDNGNTLDILKREIRKLHNAIQQLSIPLCDPSPCPKPQALETACNMHDRQLESLIEQASNSLRHSSAPSIAASSIRACLQDLWMDKAVQLLASTLPSVAPNAQPSSADSGPDAAAEPAGQHPMSSFGPTSSKGSGGHTLTHASGLASKALRPPRIQSAPLLRHDAMHGATAMPALPPGRVPGHTLARHLAGTDPPRGQLTRAAQAPGIPSLPSLELDSPADWLIHCAHLLQHQHAQMMSAATKLGQVQTQLAGTSQQLETTQADNTLLRNTLAEMQPAAGAQPRPAAARPSLSGTPEAPAAGTAPLLRQIQSLSSELAAANVALAAAHRAGERHAPDLAAAYERVATAEEKLSTQQQRITELSSQLQKALAEADNARKAAAASEAATAAAFAKVAAQKPTPLLKAHTTQTALSGAVEASVDAATALHDARSDAELAAQGHASAMSELQGECDVLRQQLHATQAQLQDANAEGPQAYALMVQLQDMMQAKAALEQQVFSLQQHLKKHAEAASAAAASLTEQQAHAQQLAQQADELRHQLQAAEQRSLHARDALQRAKEQHSEVARGLEQATARIRSLEDALQDASEATGQLQQELQLHAAANADLTAQVQAADAHAGALRSACSSVQAERDALASQLGALQAQLSLAAAARDDASARASALFSEVSGLQAALDALRGERHEAMSRLSRAQNDLEAERARLMAELQAAEALHAGLLSDAAAMKAMGTLVQAKTLRFDLSGSSTGMGMAMGGQMGAAGSAARPSTANPAAHARMQNMVRELQERLAAMQAAVSDRTERVASLEASVADLTRALAAREQQQQQQEAREAGTGAQGAELSEQLVQLQALLADKHSLTSRLSQQAEDAARRADAATRTADTLRASLAEGEQALSAAQAAAAGSRAEATLAQEQVAAVTGHCEALQSQLSKLQAAHLAATSDVATLQAQLDAIASAGAGSSVCPSADPEHVRGQGGLGMDAEAQAAALALAVARLQASERTIMQQDDHIALLQSKLQLSETKLQSMGVDTSSLIFEAAEAVMAAKRSSTSSSGSGSCGTDASDMSTATGNSNASANAGGKASSGSAHSASAQPTLQLLSVTNSKPDGLLPHRSQCVDPVHGALSTFATNAGLAGSNAARDMRVGMAAGPAAAAASGGVVGARPGSAWGAPKPRTSTANSHEGYGMPTGSSQAEIIHSQPLAATGAVVAPSGSSIAAAAFLRRTGLNGSSSAVSVAIMGMGGAGGSGAGNTPSSRPARPSSAVPASPPGHGSKHAGSGSFGVSSSRREVAGGSYTSGGSRGNSFSSATAATDGAGQRGFAGVLSSWASMGGDASAAIARRSSTTNSMPTSSVGAAWSMHGAPTASLPAARPSTAVSKKTVLLLSAALPVGVGVEGEEELVAEDGWVPV